MLGPMLSSDGSVRISPSSLVPDDAVTLAWAMTSICCSGDAAPPEIKNAARAFVEGAAAELQGLAPPPPPDQAATLIIALARMGVSNRCRTPRPGPRCLRPGGKELCYF